LINPLPHPGIPDDCLDPTAMADDVGGSPQLRDLHLSQVAIMLGSKPRNAAWKFL